MTEIILELIENGGLSISKRLYTSIVPRIGEYVFLSGERYDMTANVVEVSHWISGSGPVGVVVSANASENELENVQPFLVQDGWSVCPGTDLLIN